MAVKIPEQKLPPATKQEQVRSSAKNRRQASEAFDQVIGQTKDRDAFTLKGSSLGSITETKSSASVSKLFSKGLSEGDERAVKVLLAAAKLLMSSTKSEV